jgi:hypothetical protein
VKARKIQVSPGNVLSLSGGVGRPQDDGLPRRPPDPVPMIGLVSDHPHDGLSVGAHRHVGFLGRRHGGPASLSASTKAWDAPPRAAACCRRMASLSASVPSGNTNRSVRSLDVAARGLSGRTSQPARSRQTTTPPRETRRPACPCCKARTCRATDRRRGMSVACRASHSSMMSSRTGAGHGSNAASGSISILCTRSRTACRSAPTRSATCAPARRKAPSSSGDRAANSARMALRR